MKLEVSASNVSVLADVLQRLMVDWEIRIDNIKKGKSEIDFQLENLEKQIKVLSVLVPQNKMWASGTSHGDYLHRISPYT